MFLDNLATELITLKQERTILNDRIANLESEIILLVGEKEEGATTVNTDAFKVTTTGKVTRKIDLKSLVEISPQVGKEVMDKVVKVEPKLDLSAYRQLNDEDKSIFDKAIVTKPAKTAVSVKEL